MGKFCASGVNHSIELSLEAYPVQGRTIKLCDGDLRKFHCQRRLFRKFLLLQNRFELLIEELFPKFHNLFVILLSFEFSCLSVYLLKTLQQLPAALICEGELFPDLLRPFLNVFLCFTLRELGFLNRFSKVIYSPGKGGCLSIACLSFFPITSPDFLSWR